MDDRSPLFLIDANDGNVYEMANAGLCGMVKQAARALHVCAMFKGARCSMYDAVDVRQSVSPAL